MEFLGEYVIALVVVAVILLVGKSIYKEICSKYGWNISIKERH